jgi:hypothetical protein
MLSTDRPQTHDLAWSGSEVSDIKRQGKAMAVEDAGLHLRNCGA